MITGHDEGAWSASIPGAGNRIDNVEDGEEKDIQLLTARYKMPYAAKLNLRHFCRSWGLKKRGIGTWFLCKISAEKKWNSRCGTKKRLRSYPRCL
jgi:hypothetical protein